MAQVLDISTYTQLIDDLRMEINTVELSKLGDEQLRIWINRGQERVTDLVQVKDQYILNLTDEVTKYYFQDRPVITGATNATPIVLTSTAHGLSNGDRLLVRGVLGNTATNGRWQASSVGANAITLLFFADVSTAEAGDTTVTVTTEQDHPFTTGQTVTISGVTGMTDLNDSFVVTVTGLRTFTVPLVTTQEYTDGGECTANSVGNAAYVAGGRLWKDNEIPTFFKDFSRGKRTWSTDYHPEIEMRELNWIIDQIRTDTGINKLYTDYGSPRFAAIGMEGGVRYLEVYPAPTYDQDVTMYGSIRVTARQYDSVDLTSSILLPSQYDGAVLAYTKMKVYEWLGNTNMKNALQTEFNGEINQLRLRAPAHLRVRVTWQ